MERNKYGGINDMPNCPKRVYREVGEIDLDGVILDAIKRAVGERKVR